MNKKTTTHKNKKRLKKVLKIFARIILILLLIFILLVLFIRSPWGQNIIVNKLTNYISNKTNTEVRIDKLFITFSGDISLEGLYLEDQKGDTLIYSKALQADIPIWPIIKGNSFSVDYLEWQGLKANIVRKDSISGFNYQFLIDALATSDTTQTQTPAESQPMEIAIGDIDLSQFKVNYKDAVTGIDAEVDLGKLLYSGENFDLEQMNFEASEFILENTTANIVQTKIVPSEDTTQTVLPKFRVDEFTLNKVKANFTSVPQELSFKGDLENFYAEMPLLDLQEQTIEFTTINLKNSLVQLQIPETETNISEDSDKDSTTQSISEFWPDWQIRVAKIELENNDILYQQGNKKPIDSQFNAQNIQLSNFNFKAKDVYLSKDIKAKIKLTELTFQENVSNFDLNEFNFELQLNDQSAEITHLRLKTGSSQLAGNIAANYESLQEVIENYETAQLTANLSSIYLQVNDLFKFNPELKKNEYLRKLQQKPITGNLYATGNTSKLQLQNFNLNWGNTTKIKAKGYLAQLIDLDNLQLDLQEINISSIKKDLVQFVNEKDLGISIPQQLQLTGNAKGGLDQLTADLSLKMPEGRVAVVGNYSNKDQLTFDADVNTVELDLGTLLQNESLGKISAEISINGSGSSINTLDAQLKTKFSQLTYNEYDLSDLKLEGNIKNGSGDVTAAFKDNNVNLNLDAQVTLDSVAPKADFKLDLQGIDLYALGFTQKQIRGKLMLNGTYQGEKDAFSVDAKVDEAITVYDDQPYYIGDLDIHTRIAEDSTAVTLNGGFIQAKLHSNANPTQFIKALQRHAAHYFKEPEPRDSLQKPVNLFFETSITDRPIISEVFVDGIEEMDSIHIKMDFSEAEEKLTADFNLPYVKYNENSLDSLQLKLNSTAEKADFTFGFSGIEAGPLAIEKTYFEGHLTRDTLQLDFNSEKDQQQLYHISSKITSNNDWVQFSIDPQDLILNKNPWQTPIDNSVIFEDKTIVFNNFSFNRNNQEVAFNNNFKVEEEHFGITLQNFKLSTLLGYFNPDEYLSSGIVQGDFILVNPFEDLGMIADLKIQDFKITEIALGELSIDAKSKGGSNYDFNLGLQGSEIDLALKGDYIADEAAANIDLNLDLQKLGLPIIQQFIPEELEESKGYLSGNVSITGTTLEPQYSGEFKFNNTNFVVSKLNSEFSISNETIKINNNGINFSKFSILDENKNEFVVKGNVSTQKSMIDPAFDLQIRANNFQALNSTKEDNDLYYGKAIFDVNASLGGKLSFPKLDVDLTVNKNTNVTYVVPPSQVGVTERDGVVVFVNKENSDAILTRNENDGASAILTGIELTSKLTVQPGATVNVILNERTGDNLQLIGEGDLRFNIERNGRTTLTGRYEVNDGHYEMNLYNLVKRKFNIAEGSTITWTGDPMNANLDVRAIYEVETSAVSLMSSQISGTSATEVGRYRQKLPFLVYLNVDGELMQPRLNFGLDMPEDEQGAIGGTVYGRVRQLNQQEDQLNKQVFSLLVLNRFYPEQGADGSQGGAATVARDNLNQALSDQLNVFSDRLTGNTGIELSFGLNSYTDYQGSAPQDRTDLNVSARKKLLNDRLVVQAGSEIGVQGENRPGEANPVIGNVSIEYLLTEDGRWRIRGFRKSQYENIIDGQVFVNGVALIFMREFNKFNELFKKTASEIAQEEKQAKREEKKKKAEEEANKDAVEEEEN
ncbi:translocation/assembly module TamB [Mesonia sp.]|uniref:translocation/assembly module TamB domain-containing protein n=1 Tax=Mesonia sp. TaxID=1960830 RepID=UPI0017736345|nr:translocation/assembly module TamB [Mesonia sp.]HIB38139.1 translocation/assembly module TamB [Mesonia sp.]HIO26092.1 translocation/assembly module TamB [Flavobacteriaceae bacterium]